MQRPKDERARRGQLIWDSAVLLNHSSASSTLKQHAGRKGKTGARDSQLPGSLCGSRPLDSRLADQVRNPPEAQASAISSCPMLSCC